MEFSIRLRQYVNGHILPPLSLPLSSNLFCSVYRRFPLYSRRAVAGGRRTASGRGRTRRAATMCLGRTPPSPVTRKRAFWGGWGGLRRPGEALVRFRGTTRSKLRNRSPASHGRAAPARAFASHRGRLPPGWAARRPRTHRLLLEHARTPLSPRRHRGLQNGLARGNLPASAPLLHPALLSDTPSSESPPPTNDEAASRENASLAPAPHQPEVRPGGGGAE